MGTAPLLLDARPPCFVSQNCADYNKPELRYWLRFKGAAGDSPQMEAGLLFEFFGPLVPTVAGTWLYSGPPVVGFFGGSLTMQPRPPIPSDQRRLRVSVGTSWGGWNQTLDYASIGCGWRQWVLLNPASSPPGWTDCCVLAVRWYEDADVTLANYSAMCGF